ncbi:MAG: hypothetical protein AEth_01905 [Candidatus Argoarchaeum ethanivorans]|uniref:Transposase n=1 Tax=Candidatus Argoarchaeum ethanivorans TaxID=2608793 RepID=A0A8B3RYJ1_9EURY|nr:MAG: hypothetical protein AEth_01905 [Candidatus Argoarchaeum ethanivorans]
MVEQVVDKKKRIIYGNSDLTDIETADVESFNGILRERIGRLVRKTKCFSKYKRRLEYAIELFQFYRDFINEFKSGTTPAMLEGLTDHIWDGMNFFISQSNCDGTPRRRAVGHVPCRRFVIQSYSKI